MTEPENEDGTGGDRGLVEEGAAHAAASGGRRQVSGGTRLRGRFRPPGDKSISHRALLIGALAQGPSRIEGLLDSADLAATRRLVEAVGVRVEEDDAGAVRVLPPERLIEPGDVIDCGNSGTTTRLGMGLLAGLPFSATLTGDASLRRRPMRRVLEPLARLGARALGRAGGDLLPVTLAGGGLRGGEIELEMASGQVKGALLLAGLAAEGELRLRGRLEGRDHTERMLAAAGVELAVTQDEIRLPGPQRPTALEGQIPGDPSSAAFFLCAAAASPGSEVVAEGVGLNPGRTGFLEVLDAMGAEVEVVKTHESLGEPVGEVRVRGKRLRGVCWEPSWVVRAIDEIPVLVAISCLAEGETVLRGAEELRVKESDRLATVHRELARLGAALEELPDGLRLSGPQVLEGAPVEGHGDHRIVMTLAVTGLLAEGTTTLLDGALVEVSYPGFFEELAALAA